MSAQYKWLFIAKSLITEDFKNRDLVYWIYNKLYTHQIMYREDERNTQPFEGTYLNRNTISEKLKVSTKHITAAITKLLDLNLIYKTGKYKVGEKSNRYKLLDTCLLSGFNTRVLNNNKYRENQMKYDALKLEQLNIAYKLLKESMDRFTFQVPYTEMAKLNCTEMRYTELLQNDLYYYKVSEKCHRLYTHYTAMPSGLRKYLKHEDGSTLVEIDITSAQPYLLSAFMKDRTEPDVVEWKELCKTGLLYEAFMTGNLSRDQVKLDFLIALYGEKSTPMKKAICEKFPTVYKVLYGLDADGVHRAVHLQRKEAELMLFTIAAKCVMKGIDAITIHDSIIIKEKDLDTALEIFTQSCETMIGYPANLKIKPVILCERKSKKNNKK